MLYQLEENDTGTVLDSELVEGTPINTYRLQKLEQ